jgi:hypothetical protein
MNPDERRSLADRAFRHAVRDDLHEASMDLERILADSNVIQMFSVCCAFASAGTDALRRQYAARDTGPVDFMYLVPEHDDTSASPTRAFARRFIVAMANRDHEIAKALFMTAFHATGGQYELSVAALLTEAADLHVDVCCKSHRT